MTLPQTRKKISLLVLMATVVGIASTAMYTNMSIIPTVQNAEATGNKIEICHVPNLNLDQAFTKLVSKNSAKNHLKNHPGDSLGPCVPQLQTLNIYERSSQDTMDPGETGGAAVFCDEEGDQVTGGGFYLFDQSANFFVYGSQPESEEGFDGWTVYAQNDSNVQKTYAFYVLCLDKTP